MAFRRPHGRATSPVGQEVGGRAIEASKIVGHRDLEMSSEYPFAAPERQYGLTRRIPHKDLHGFWKFSPHPRDATHYPDKATD